MVQQKKKKKKKKKNHKSTMKLTFLMRYSVVHLQILYQSQFAALYTFGNNNTVLSVKRLLPW